MCKSQFITLPFHLMTRSQNFHLHHSKEKTLFRFEENHPCIIAMSAQLAKTPTVQGVLRRLDSFTVPLNFHRFYLFLTTHEVSIFFTPNLYFTSFMTLYDSLLINQMETSNNGFSIGTKVR